MAAAVDIRACVSSLTKCPICLENFDQPKSLPCLHTYCLKCLKSLCQSVRPGQKKPCPKCRKEFRIPGGGVDDLPSNFDMVALLEAHRGVEYCEQHADEAMKLYCFDCNSDICVLCFALAHAQHRCDDVKTVAERFRQQIDRDVERVFSRFDEIQNAVQQLNDEHQRYDAETKQLVAAIRHQGKIFKQFIDRQVNSLIQRAETMKNETLGDIQQHKERLELSLAALESFKSYSHEIKTKSRVRNMMRVASDLRDRVDDLLRSSVSLRDYRAPVISFVPTDFMRLMRSAKIEQDFIGKLSNITTTADVPSPNVARNDITASPAAPPTNRPEVVRLRHTFPVDRTVRGVTTLDDELFVLRLPANNQIEVFNVDDYSLQRHLSVPRLRDAVDMASCSHHRCLYVADDTRCCIIRADARGADIHQWTTVEKPTGLSVTGGHVLVTCRDHGRLKLFTADGELLQQVELETAVGTLCHAVVLHWQEDARTRDAVRLLPSRYVVCSGSRSDHEQRVFVVSSAGQLVSSYGGPRGGSVGQLDFPRHVAVLGDQCVFIADFNNQRVARLTSTLDFVCEISANDRRLDFCPYRLCVDERRRRLYVGGLIRGGDLGRLAVFDI